MGLLDARATSTGCVGVSDALTRGAQGAAVTVLGQAVKVLVRFGSVVVVSRLLEPADFGLIAMVGVFIAFGETIRDFGMTLIGLQRRELSHQEASNLFWVNTTLGLTAGSLLAASAGLLVSLYDEPRLWWLVPALAPTLLINGMAAQIRVQLSRSMRFRLIVLLDLSGLLLEIAVTIALAVLGFGYWALVISGLVAASFGLVAPWIATRWLPTRPRSDGASRQLLGDGAAFGVAHLLGYLASNVDTLAIGMRWGPQSVGLYNRGYQLLTLPIQQLMGPLTQVILPTVNRAVDEGHTASAVLMRVQFALGLFVIWLFAVTGATADWLIPFILGEEWRPVAPLFRALAFGGFVWSFSQVNYWRVIIDNQGRHLIYLNLVTKSITVVLIITASFFSVEAVAWASTAGLALTWPIALTWFRAVSHWDSWRQFANGMRLMVPGILATLTGLWVMGQAHGAYAALSAALVVTMIYFVGIVVVPGGLRELKAALSMAGELLPRGRNERNVTHL